MVTSPAAGSRAGRLADRLLAVGLGLVADALVGEPPAALHPVAAFGAGMTRLEARTWADRRTAGAWYAAAGIGGAAALGAGAARLAGRRASLVAAVWVASAGRCLVEHAAAVADALEVGDLEGARRLLPALVGRSPDELDEKEIARAVVESLAENLSDAVVASAVWGVVGGTPMVLAHRAANTLDAMVGHRNARHARFGWASARADDVLGWPAARVTAALTACSVPSAAATVWRTVRRDAPSHPSPNAGVAEAAFAAALGLRLGGTNRYGERVELRPSMGEGRSAGVADVRAAIALTNRVRLVCCALLVGAAAVLRAAGSTR